jgi:hypothetical protein
VLLVDKVLLFHLVFLVLLLLLRRLFPLMRDLVLLLPESLALLLVPLKDVLVV